MWAYPCLDTVASISEKRVYWRMAEEHTHTLEDGDRMSQKNTYLLRVALN